MSKQDPQWQAVANAHALLKEHRYWSRTEEAQQEYLDDVIELARELSFVLNQAGVTWNDVEHAVTDASSTMRQMFDLAGGPSLEYALCVATAKRKQQDASAKTALRVVPDTENDLRGETT